MTEEGEEEEGDILVLVLVLEGTELWEDSLIEFFLVCQYCQREG